MMKNQKGITLIALVITIIVLLILAGVSIAMLSGDNGVLTKASKAASDTAVAEAKELAAMEVVANYADYLEDKYTNGLTTAYTGFATKKEETGKYSITGLNITITPKTSDGKTVTGTIGTNGNITWTESAGE